MARFCIHRNPMAKEPIRSATKCIEHGSDLDCKDILRAMMRFGMQQDPTNKEDIRSAKKFEGLRRDLLCKETHRYGPYSGLNEIQRKRN